MGWSMLNCFTRDLSKIMAPKWLKDSINGLWLIFNDHIIFNFDMIGYEIHDRPYGYMKDEIDDLQDLVWRYQLWSMSLIEMKYFIIVFDDFKMLKCGFKKNKIVNQEGVSPNNSTPETWVLPT